MATFLDITLLSKAEVIFAFIFVWIIVFAILSYKEWLGPDNKHIYAIIAFAVALMTVSARSVLAVITKTVPWFVYLIIILTFIIITASAVGYSPDYIFKTITGDNWKSTIGMWIVVISVIVMLAGLGSVFFNDESEFSHELDSEGNQITTSPTKTTIDIDNGVITTADPDERGEGAFFAALFHPKVLGMMAVMLIGAMTIQFLGKGSFSS